MASAPRDRGFIIVKLTDHRSHRRKYWEYIVRWHGWGVNPHWRGFTIGIVIKDSDCVGWRPMDHKVWRAAIEAGSPGTPQTGEGRPQLYVDVTGRADGVAFKLVWEIAELSD
jgi:hypothetical protein